MKTNKVCPQCQTPLPADAPDGHCPACLLQGGLSTRPAGGETVPLGGQAAAPRRVLPEPGQQFGGYRIARELGRGGMGAVYEAEQLETGRRVALKVLGHKLDSSEARARFMREGRLAASINHPNSVYVFGTEEIDGTPAIAMELIAGGTLQERVQRGGPLPIGQAVDAILQVIAGLEAAQAIGILHRDIKPANCFEDADGTVKIGDFGLSISTAARGDTNLTLQGQFLGTPAFCSPEQLRGEELNVRSDVYSVGVTLFYLLTGRTPFEGKEFVQLLSNVLEKPAPSPKKFQASVPVALATLVLRCLEKTPGDRFKNYNELRQALAPFSSDAPVPAPLALRFAAGAFDLLLLSACGAILGTSTGMFDFQDFTSTARQLSPALLTQMVLWSVVALAYFAVLEGWRGASLGKTLCRLRLAGPDRNPPGVARALARAMIFLLLPPLPYWIAFGINPYAAMAHGGQFAMYLISLLYYVLLALLFCTARRRNGFAALQDLLTGTRVIRKPAYQARPVSTATETTALATENQVKVGPYHLIETLEKTADSEWLLGYDTRLLRKAWIHIVAPGTPPVASPLRNLGRVGRLRWITGRRGAAENWDAFEGVTGSPLAKLLGQPQPWSQVRYWLLDLATEFSTAQKDGTLPAVLALDRVWITADGRAKLLDFPAPGGGGIELAGTTTLPPVVADQTAVQDFLHEVATRSLAGSDSTPARAGQAPALGPLPLHAREFLEKLRHFAGLDAILAALRPLVQQMAVVTRRRRMVLVAACLAVPLVAGLGIMVAGRLWDQWQRQQPGLMELSQVLNVRSGLHMAERWSKQKPLVDDTAFAIYVASHQRAVITNAGSWSNYLALVLIPPGENRIFAEQAVADHPQPTEKEIEAATALVRPFVPQANPMNILGQVWMLPLVAWMSLLMYVALPALLAALLFRGGLLLRMLGLAVVRKDGARASRLRVFWRSLVAWSPLLAPVVFALAASALAILAIAPARRLAEAPPPPPIVVEAQTNLVPTHPSPVVETALPVTDTLAVTNIPATAQAPKFSPFGDSVPPVVIWGGSLLALLVLGLTSLSLALPGRSLQDRIAGTCLVPR
jgi:hypothetical protein